MASSYINSLALVLCVHLSLLSALLTCGTVYLGYTSVDFITLSAFKRSLQRINLNEFLTVYKFSVVYDCV